MKTKETKKIVIYQAFTRLFGNTCTLNRPWGTLEENGVGKLADFSDRALEALKDLGVSHIWYTGVLRHAKVTDYREFGIPGDDPDVVKGRAGSPYAIKDYYDVDPDLATRPDHRMEELESLIDRTHLHGLQVIVDIVPNHVARAYHSVSLPDGIQDFGEKDDPSFEYLRDNNFYYIPGQPFRVPTWKDGYRVLGGEAHPLADGYFQEYPAKWTGNGTRSPHPDMYDWYETVKINFGIRPDGSKDFPELPEGMDSSPAETHADFWKDQEVPDSWKKFREIAFFWLDKGVDGFRYDMAQMVPVEFWSYLNSAIRMKNPDAILISEIYVPDLYRDYIHKGLMDYLYDKEDLYNTLVNLLKGTGSSDDIAAVQDRLGDIEHHMLRFLENHDEQRIASPQFLGDAKRGLPGMVAAATLGNTPIMIYTGQHVGEPGAEQAGFGSPSRTSIFDYVGIPAHQRWMNGGRFDGGALNQEEKSLNQYYRNLLLYTRRSKAVTGAYREIHRFNRQYTEWYNDRVFSFVRWKDGEKLLICINFDGASGFGFELQLPPDLVREWNLANGTHMLRNALDNRVLPLVVNGSGASARIDLSPSESLILEL